MRALASPACGNRVLVLPALSWQNGWMHVGHRIPNLNLNPQPSPLTLNLNLNLNLNPNPNPNLNPQPSTLNPNPNPSTSCAPQRATGLRN